MQTKLTPHYSQAATEASEGMPESLGQSENFLHFFEKLSSVAKVDRPVLLVGERGTGKELAAARLHYLSERWQGPLVALNCPALAASLLESELFGYETGAFTGAGKRRRGRFEAANEGTLFLDEIGLIPIEVQQKILRAVEYGTFERVGSSESVHVNVRIIGATNADLPDLAGRGEFKQDLLDRLSFEVLFLPPLRERRDDVMLLARHFAARMALELGRAEVPEFSDRAIESLENYGWPGNVRELKNVVERAVFRSGQGLVDEIEFDPFRSPYEALRVKEKSDAAPWRDKRAPFEPPFIGQKSLKEMLGELELGALKNALEKSRYHQGKAADILGLTYHQFRGLYRKFRKQIETTREESVEPGPGMPGSE